MESWARGQSDIRKYNRSWDVHRSKDDLLNAVCISWMFALLNGHRNLSPALNVPRKRSRGCIWSQDLLIAHGGYFPRQTGYFLYNLPMPLQLFLSGFQGMPHDAGLAEGLPLFCADKFAERVGFGSDDPGKDQIECPTTSHII